MDAASKRVAARVRLRIGEAIDAPWHPSVVSTRELLIGDTPEQHAADLEVLQRWKAAHPDAFPPDEGAGARIMQKLEEMARRQEAHDELRAQDLQT
jgi:predicted nucleic acid-binding protein